ncbi:MAG: hypothetical protein AAF985_18720 [Bacteroidota bacterium]
MARITGLYLLLLLLTAAACNKDKEVPNEIININDDLQIIIWEDLTNEERHLTFTVETITNQNCENYQFDYSLNQFAQQINLSINQLSLQEECQPGSAPARQSIAIGELAPNNYNLELNLNNNEIVNPGRLLVSFSQYQIILDSDHGLIVPDKTLNRIPEQTIWGYIGFNDLNQESDVRIDFENSMADLVRPHSLSSGYYGQFRLSELNELTIRTEQEYREQHNFLYEFGGNEQDLIAPLENLRATYGEAIEIKLFTAKGTIL